MHIRRMILPILLFGAAFVWPAACIAADSNLCSVEAMEGYRVDVAADFTELSMPLNLLKFTGTLEDQRGRIALIRVPEGETSRAWIGSSIGPYHGRVVEVREDAVVIVENATRCRSYGRDPCMTSPQCRELRIGEGPSIKELEAYRYRRANPTEEDLKVCCN